MLGKHSTSWATFPAPHRTFYYSMGYNWFLILLIVGFNNLNILFMCFNLVGGVHVLWNVREGQRTTASRRRWAAAAAAGALHRNPPRES